MGAFEKYEKAKNYFSTIESEILADIELSEYKNSLKSLYHKTRTIDILKDGIANSATNLYAAKILHRSLIEHYLLGYYIFLRCKVEGTDIVGEEYYDAYANSEFFKQESYSIRLADMRNSISRTVNVDVLKERYPGLADLSQQDLNEYHRIANGLSDVKKIGEYILKHKNIEPKLDKLNEITFNLLEEYNLLSSYVHGGPYAERTTFESDQHPAEEFNNLLEWALTIAHLIKVFLVLALRNEFEKKYSKHFTALYL